MVVHYATAERSSADGYPRINSVLVQFLTKGQCEAILPRECTKLQELRKIEDVTNKD